MNWHHIYCFISIFLVLQCQPEKSQNEPPMFAVSETVNQENISIQDLETRLADLFSEDYSLARTKFQKTKNETRGVSIRKDLIASTTIQERIVAARLLAKTAGLSKEMEENLIQICTDDEAFVEDLEILFVGFEIPDRWDSENGAQSIFATVDLACTWLYNPHPGTELGAEFWTAAVLCALAHVATEAPAHLRYHTHTLTIPYVQASYPVYTFE